MILTEERAKALVDYLSADEERMNKVAELTPAEAMKVINADGFDYTVEEIEEFGKEIQLAVAKSGEGELDADSLDDVSGGVAIAVGTAVALFGVGYKMGTDCAKKWGW